MPKRVFDKLSFPAKTSVSVGAGILFALVLCFAFAFIATFGEDGTKNLTLYGEIAFIMSMFFCGFVGAKIGSDKKFASGLVAAGIMLAINAFFALFFCKSGIIKALVLALLGVFSSAAGAALGSREQKRKRRR